MDNAAILSRAWQVMETEIDGLRTAQAALGEDFLATVHLILKTIENGGKIVVTGVGKNLHIAEKLSATLASTGSTSVVMNPIQAMHGDLGMIAEDDVLLALSFSGESDEVIKLIPAVRRLGIKVIGMVGNPDSTLARLSDVTLLVRIGKEACPFGMAPTTSTTATLAVGDALAMVVLEARGFKKEDYATLHPGGSIGRTLLLKVTDIMRTGDRMAMVTKGQKVQDAVLAMTEARTGCVVIVDGDNAVAGIFTDGDLRRHINSPDLPNQIIDSVMSVNPITLKQDQLAVEVLAEFQRRNVDDLIVVDDTGRLAGVVDIQDLPKFKIL